MNPMQRLEVISTAIWLRDNATRISREEMLEKLSDLAEYGILSNRQLAKIVRGKISHTTIAQHTQKKSKTGGSLSPEALEDIREALFSRERKAIDYDAISRALSKGTSQNMITKLTGISQSSISRRTKNAS